MLRARSRGNLNIVCAAVSLLTALANREAKAADEIATNQNELEEQASEAATSSEANSSERVVVRGKRAASDEHSSTSTVDEKRLRAAGANLNQLIESNPGVMVEQNGSEAEASNVVVRGMMPATLPVYFNGVPLNDESSGTAAIQDFAPWMLSGIELIRSPGAILGKAGAAGAVLLKARETHSNHLVARAEMGSFGYYRLGGGAGVSEQGKDAQIAAELSSSTNDYSYEDQRYGSTETKQRENADYTRGSFSAAGGVPLAGGMLRQIFIGSTLSQGVPGLAQQPAVSARSTQQRLILGSQYSRGCELESSKKCVWKAALYAGSSGSILHDPQSELGTSSSYSLEDQWQAGLDAELEYEILPQLEASFRFEERATQMMIQSVGVYKNDSSRITFGGFTGLKWQASSKFELLAEGGVRLQHTTFHADEKQLSSDNLATSTTQLPSTIRVSSRYRLSSWFDLRAQIASVSRTPTLGELYGLMPLVRGNPSLQVETSRSAELASKWTMPKQGVWDWGVGDLTLFYQDVVDLIGYRQSSQGTLRPFNLGLATNIGFEFEWQPRLFEEIQFRIYGTLMHSQVQNEDSQNGAQSVVPFRPQGIFGSDVEWNFEKLIPWLSRGDCGAAFRYLGDRYADPAGYTIIPEQLTIDLSLRFSPKSSPFLINFNVKNLLGTERYDWVGLPLAPRAFYLSLEWGSEQFR